MVAAGLSLTPPVSSSCCMSRYFPFLLAVYNCLFQFHGVATCLSLSFMDAGCLSLSLLVPWNCCMSLTISHCCWLSLTFSSSSMEFLHVPHCLQLMLAVSQFLSQYHGVQRQQAALSDSVRHSTSGDTMSNSKQICPGDSERHSATPWHCRNFIGLERQ